MGIPYSQFFWADYLKDTRILSLEAKGAWMDILCHLANADEVGVSGHRIDIWARVLGCPKRVAKRILTELEDAKVGEIWTENEKVFIKNNRLCDDYLEYKERILNCSKGGKKSAKNKRKYLEINESNVSQVASEEVTGDPNQLNGKLNSTTKGRATKSLPLPLPITTLFKEESKDRSAEIPTWDEVWDLAQMRGILRETAESFFNWHNDNNYWLNKYGALINWKSKLQNWKTRSQNIKTQGNAPKRKRATADELLRRLSND